MVTLHRASGGPVHVLDVGGNVGFMALFAASIGPLVHVTTVEPHPWHRRLLQPSIAINGLNDRVRVEGTLLGPKAAAPPACIFVSDPRNAGSTEVKLDAEVKECRALGGEMVGMTTIDAILDASPFGRRVDVLKIDVEARH